MIRLISRLVFLLYLIGILFNTCNAQVDISSSNDYIDCKLIDKYKTKRGAYYDGHGFFSPTNRYFIFEADGYPNFIDLNSKQVIITKPNLSIKNLHFIDDNVITADQRVTWGDYRMIITYDLSSNMFISEKPLNEKKYPNKAYSLDDTFVFSKDKSIIAAIGHIDSDEYDFDMRYKYIIAISLSNGTYRRIIDYGKPSEKIFSIDISPNNKYIVAGGENKKIKVWKIEQGLSIKTIHTYGDITSICFHPSGDFIACGDMNGKIYLISTDNWEIIKSFTPSSLNRIYDIEFDPKGYLLSCLIDNELLIINAFSENELVKKISDAKKKLIFLTYSNDGRELMAVGRDRYAYHYHIDYNKSESFTEILDQQAKFLNKLLDNTNTANRTRYHVVDTKPLNKDQTENNNNLVFKVEDELKIQFTENSLDSPTLLKVSKLSTNPDILNSFDYYSVSPIFEINCSEKFNKPFQIGLKLSDNNLDEQDTVFVGRISNGKLELLNTVYDINSDYYFAESNEFSFWGLFIKKKPRFKFVTVTPFEYSGIEPRGIEDYENCVNCLYDDIRTENFKEDLVIKCGVIDEQSKIIKARLKVKVHGNVEWAYDMIQKVVLSYTNIGYNQILTAPILNRKQSHQSMYIDAYFPTEGKMENEVGLRFYEFTISKEDLSNILCGVSWINSIDLQVLLLDDEGKVKRESEIKSINFFTKNKPQISLVYPSQTGNSQQFFLWRILNNDNSVDLDYQVGEFKIFIDTDENPYDGGWLAFEDGTSSLPTAEYFNHDPIRVNYRNSTNKLERGKRYYWGVTISKHNSKKKQDIVYSGVESFYVNKNVFLTNPTKNYIWYLKDYNQRKIVSCDFKDYTGRVAIELLKHKDLHTPVKRLFKPNFNKSIDIAYDLGELDEGFYKIKLTLMDIQAMPYGFSETFIIKNNTQKDELMEDYVQESEQEDKMSDGEFLMQLAGNVVVNQINNKINERIDEYQNDYSSGQNSSVKQEGTNIPNISGTWFDVASGYKLRVISQNGTICKGSFSNELSGESWGVNIHIVDTFDPGHQVQKAPWIKVNSGGRYCIWFDVNAGFNLESGIFSCTLSNSGNAISVNSLYKRIMKDGSLTIRTGEFKPVKWSSKFTKIN